MRVTVFGLFLFLVGCSTGSWLPPQNEPYQSAGTEQFFFAELPAWANGNLSAGCLRSTSVRYLDHAPLSRIHALSFLQRLELQTQFNRKWSERYARQITQGLTPQEEAVLFLETLEQVKGGNRELVFPDKGPIQLVWWDRLSTEPWFKKWLLKLASTGEPIVLMSFCLTAGELEIVLKKQPWEEQDFFLLGAESMGPVINEGPNQGGVMMPLEAILPRERTTLWMSGNYPAELPSGYNVKTVEGLHVR